MTHDNLDICCHTTVEKVTPNGKESCQDFLAQECAVALSYNGISHAVLMATPQNLEALALGFSLTEGIIDHAGQFYDCDIHNHQDGIEIAINIASAAAVRLKDKRRLMNGNTGCGLCGIERLSTALPKLDALNHPQAAPSVSSVEQALAQLADFQPLRAQTGAVHAAAWVNNQGIHTCCEDIGRHNALDKLIGKLTAANINPKEGWILISSRASHEMIVKTVRFGAGILVARAAPTALAVAEAKQWHLTLIGFAKSTHYTLYHHAQ